MIQRVWESPDFEAQHDPRPGARGPLVATPDEVVAMHGLLGMAMRDAIARRDVEALVDLLAVREEWNR